MHSIHATAQLNVASSGYLFDSVSLTSDEALELSRRAMVSAEYSLG